MKNEVMNKPFPYNLFDDLDITPPAEEPADFNATLMYILRCISTPRDSKAIMMRYKDGKTFEEIGVAFGLSKQRANYMISDILCKFTSSYLEMLTKGIKRYYEELFNDRIKELTPIIADSEREEIQMTAYADGYKKGFENGLINRNEGSANQTALDTVLLSTLQLSTRTYNSLVRNGAKTLGEVVSYGDNLIDFIAFGKTCFIEIANVLKDYGVNIRATFPDCVRKWGEV